jgi:hypothetical protein
VARYLHNPSLGFEDDDEEENPNGVAERRVAEIPAEMERRVAEERRVAQARKQGRLDAGRRVGEIRAEMERRVAEARDQGRLEMGRWMAADIDRRLAEARSAAE